MRIVGIKHLLIAGFMLPGICLAQPRVPYPEGRPTHKGPLQPLDMHDEMQSISTFFCPPNKTHVNIIRLHVKADALATSKSQFCNGCFGFLTADTVDSAGTLKYTSSETLSNTAASNFQINDYATPWDFDIKKTATIVEIILDDPNAAFWHPFTGGGSASDVVDVDTTHAQYFGCLKQVSSTTVSFYVRASLPLRENIPASININVLLGVAPAQLPIAIDPHPTNNG